MRASVGTNRGVAVGCVWFALFLSVQVGCGSDATTGDVQAQDQGIDIGIQDSGPDVAAADDGGRDSLPADVQDFDSVTDTRDATDAAPDDDAQDDVATPDGVLDDATSDSGGDVVVGDDGADSGDFGTWPDVIAQDAGQDMAATCDPVIFDRAMIRDPSTLNCQLTNHRTELKGATLVDVWDVSFTSWESIDCELHPITIHGYAAKPASLSSNMPGVVHMHGLGGCADPDNATGPAVLLDAFVIAPTGPGGAPSENEPDCAASEGRPSGYDSGIRMFDTVPDPRGSWFWAHSVTAMRAVTCLETRSEVDDSRLGMTGYSAGAVATLISSAVDNRLVASVPLSGTGAWGVATQSANAWQHHLLGLAGLDTASSEWQRLISTILPDVNMSGSTTKILMANGSSDEFFPLTAHMATYNSIPGADKRTAIIANWDHGCCLLIDGLCGLEDAETIETRAVLGGSGNQRAWFAHWFGTDDDFSYYPSAPEVQVMGAGAATYVMAAVDGGGGKLDVESVRFWGSNDGAMNFFGQDMAWNDSLKVWDVTLPLVVGPTDIYFVEVVYTNGGLILPKRFLLTSVPHVPDGVIPVIHPMDDCVL